MRGRIISYLAPHRKDILEKHKGIIDKLRQTQQTYQDNPTYKTKQEWVETKQQYDISADEVERLQKDLRDLRFHRHGNKVGKLLSYLTKEPHASIKIHSMSK